ncbi:thioredoxin-domain-containing protein [Laetiporus sulphureus 93-53]|uniref:Thioredoxin-domain-containing protein n=1 Tax=Laetiporus sulphureus 93-53 TaxID=1314785 RepID=A0A165IK65_9APHY|nr:thioredoxin-domain-containing protein [Laetiporus sulphureus 93-53]KZT13191.1 thioredoxin-domain-containing protein [Laetiporus sulphureus 93-53]
MQLPSALLVAALALGAASLPVDSVELPGALTPDNFQDTIAHGVWLVEHFSPYCGHCRNFSPTWRQLVEANQNQSDPGIHLTQVNCAVHGDLCRQNRVDGYPQMNLYRDGDFVEAYKQARTFEFLTEYLAKHAEPTTVPTPTAVVEPTLEPTPAPVPAPALQVNAPPEYRDDSRFKVPAKDYNPKGAVLSLSDETFRSAADEGHLFVKFFAPWCGHCKKLAPTWTQLAGVMQHKLAIAEVNCDEHAALCSAEGVKGFPTLIYYGGQGAGRTEYNSGRKLEQLKAFAEKVSGPPVKEIRYEDFADTLASEPVLYLFLHTPSDTQSRTDVLDAAQVLFGSPPLYISTSLQLFEQFSVPQDAAVLLALKDHDSAPVATYTLSSDAQATAKDGLVDWLLRNRIPASLELDSDTFQEVMNAPHHPLVVIAAAPKTQLDATAANVRSLARQWRAAGGDAGITFVWMDADKWETWLKSMYGMTAVTEPTVVLANHSRLVYYDADQLGERIQLTPTSVFSAITGARNATIPYKHSANIVERMARYLNGKLTSIQAFVTTYPWRTAFFFLSGVIFVIFLLKRLFIDAEPRDYYNARKSDRLD